MSRLKVGDRVKQGQPVGRVGNSGTCSRGAHLHLTMSKKSDPRWAKTFDPEKFIDQKIAKQEKIAKRNKSAKQKHAKEITTETFPKKTLIGTIWTWSKFGRK